MVTANIQTLNAVFSNLLNLNVSTGANVTYLTAGQANLVSSNLITANVQTLNSIFSNLTTTNVQTLNAVFSNILNLNVSTGANITYLTADQANLVSSNLVTANVQTLNAVFSNLLNLNVSTGANVTYLTAGQANLVSSNLVTANVQTLNAVFSNLLNLNVSTGANVTYLSAGQANVVSSNLVTANVQTLNAVFSNLLNLNVSTGANVTYLSAGQANVVSSNLITANVQTLNAVFSNILNLNVSTGANVTYLTAGQANLVSSNLLTANVQTLNTVFSNILNLNVSTGANVTYLTAGQANLISSNLLTANIQTGNVVFLNVSTTANVTNLTVTSNIVPLSATGNTHLTGNLIATGNLYSQIGQLGVGGSLFFNLGSTLVPSSYTGSVPVAGTNTYALRLNAFTQQGTSTYINLSANGCLQFSQTGIYTISGIFLTNFNNVLGIGIGSNAIDYGTRTDQTYLYSLIPSFSQNPTDVLETQFYVSSTTAFYYIDLFAVDSIILQPTASVSGGTWVSVAPLGGITAISTQIPMSSPGNVVMGQTSSYGAQVTDYYIGVNGVGVTVTLPIGASLNPGKTYFIKDESGVALVNNITVASTVPNLIDGSASVLINRNYMALQVIWTGTFWSII